MHVEHPAGLKPPDATDFVAANEGLRYEYRQLGTRQPKGTGKDTYKKKQPLLAIEDQGQPWPAVSSSSTAPWNDDPRTRQHCRDWMGGGCVRKGLCPNNRIHTFPPGWKPGKGGGKGGKAGKAAAAAAAAAVPKPPGQTPADPHSNKSLRKAARAAKAPAHV